MNKKAAIYLFWVLLLSSFVFGSENTAERPIACTGSGNNGPFKFSMNSIGVVPVREANCSKIRDNTNSYWAKRIGSLNDTGSAINSFIRNANRTCTNYYSCSGGCQSDVSDCQSRAVFNVDDIIHKLSKVDCRVIGETNDTKKRNEVLVFLNFTIPNAYTCACGCPDVTLGMQLPESKNYLATIPEFRRNIVINDIFKTKDDLLIKKPIVYRDIKPIKQTKATIIFEEEQNGFFARSVDSIVWFFTSLFEIITSPLYNLGILKTETTISGGCHATSGGENKKVTFPDPQNEGSEVIAPINARSCDEVKQSTNMTEVIKEMKKKLTISLNDACVKFDSKNEKFSCGGSCKSSNSCLPHAEFDLSADDIDCQQITNNAHSKTNTFNLTLKNTFTVDCTCGCRQAEETQGGSVNGGENNGGTTRSTQNVTEPIVIMPGQVGYNETVDAIGCQGPRNNTNFSLINHLVFYKDYQISITNCMKMIELLRTPREKQSLISKIKPVLNKNCRENNPCGGNCASGLGCSSKAILNKDAQFTFKCTKSGIRCYNNGHNQTSLYDFYVSAENAYTCGCGCKETSVAGQAKSGPAQNQVEEVSDKQVDCTSSGNSGPYSINIDNFYVGKPTDCNNWKSYRYDNVESISQAMISQANWQANKVCNDPSKFSCGGQCSENSCCKSSVVGLNIKESDIKCRITPKNDTNIGPDIAQFIISKENAFNCSCGCPSTTTAGEGSATNSG